MAMPIVDIASAVGGILGASACWLLLECTSGEGS
jgi:hypothetical protein